MIVALPGLSLTFFSSVFDEVPFILCCRCMSFNSCPVSLYAMTHDSDFLSVYLDIYLYIHTK